MKASGKILQANFDPKPETCPIFVRFLVKSYHFEPERHQSKNMTILDVSRKLFWSILLFATACGSSGDESAHNTAAAAKTSPDGLAIFRQKCVTCHGADGTLGLNGAKDFTKSTLSVGERVSIITNGKNLMTPFGGILRPEEIQAVAEYTVTLKK